MFKFPFSNLHELNLDWILSIVKRFSELIPPMETAVEDVQALQGDVEQAVTDANAAVTAANEAAETAAEALEVAEQAASGTIADGAVTTAKLANNAVTTDKILNGTILSEDMAAGAALGNITDGSITAAKLATSAAVANIADGTLPGAKIADSSILGSKLADGAAVNRVISDGAVTNGKIADGAVSNIKLSDAVKNKGRYYHEQGYHVTMPENIDTTITSITLTPGAWFIVGRVTQQDSQTIFVNAYLIHCTYTLNGKSNTNNGSTAFAFGIVEVPAGSTATVELQSYPYDSSHRVVTGDILAIQLSQPD